MHTYRFSRQKPVLVAAIVALVVILASITVVVQFSGNQSQKTDENVLGNQKSYQSKSLGLTFRYASRNDLGQKIMIRELDDTIYVYLENAQMEQGQFVRVFGKSPDQSLKQAIEEQFLKGHDPDLCFVQSGTDINGTQATNGIAYIIAYPQTDDTNNSGLRNAVNCPEVYSLTNGISYFWTDRETSDKFVFFSLGQYYIPATSTVSSWHLTLKFL